MGTHIGHHCILLLTEHCNILLKSLQHTLTYFRSAADMGHKHRPNFVNVKGRLAGSTKGSHCYTSIQRELSCGETESTTQTRRHQEREVNPVKINLFIFTYRKLASGNSCPSFFFFGNSCPFPYSLNRCNILLESLQHTP